MSFYIDHHLHQTRLRECLLNQKALPSDSAILCEAEPGKLDTIYANLVFTHKLTLQIGDYDVIIDFRGDFYVALKVQGGLNGDYCHDIDSVYQANVQQCS